MALTAGTRLGPYAIESPLGSGGMGEVYRARDTKLDRDVAIKVLPDAFVADPEPEPVLSLRATGTQFGTDIDRSPYLLGPNGRGYIGAQGIALGKPSPLTVVMNWRADGDRREPSATIR